MPNENKLTETGFGDYHHKAHVYYPLQGIDYEQFENRSRNPTAVVSLERQGTKTPSYSKRLEAGMLPVNPFYFRNRVTSYPTIDARSIQSSYNYLREETMSGPVPPSSEIAVFLSTSGLYERRDLITSAANESIARFLADVKGQKINVAQFFAERKQTINLIAQSAQKIAGFLLALKKGDIISAGKALGSRPSRSVRRGFRQLYAQSPRDAASDAWLALQYGWKPLMSDIYGAVQLLAERDSDFQRHVAKSKASREDTTESRIGGGPLGYWKVTTKVRVVVRYTGIFDITQSTLQRMSNIGLTNPAQLAWELVPYSFVVDWFLPIGNYLASLDATSGVTLAQGSLVVYEKWKLSAEFVPHQSFGLVSYSGSGEGYSSCVRITRSPLNGFPSPPLPALKNPFSVTHALNALALISGAASRRKS